MRTTSFNGVLALVLVAATSIDPSAAFSQPQQQRQQQKQAKLSSSRRTFFGKSSELAKYAAATLAGSAGIILQRPAPANAAIKTGAANPFTGDYDDPMHPGCLRQVKVVGAPLGGNGIRSSFPVIEVVGWDGPKGAKACTTRPNLADLWQVKGKITSTSTAVLDFSLKGGPDSLLATYDGGKIVFPDGNTWKKIAEQKERRPKDTSTLSDGPSFRERDDDE
mmetsp:Transcript_17477/g.20165  ORF Transcript_17477/g.20165 Transcript_17477/m.20165 type:complete len:221 (-) Transcript_17477:364-1026(-)|eukprot:CAMPEP_0194430676 /NCGR_PEP_ID=MMETSP0176-20130528/57720_1 /TAXON_ID=216777 /ORGANISM="Proboscia alata, Strain PI-D3" /LENGTH=220 /DNA_ID=CAMNT_0039245235 /DNA_START=70 /DNA_END=735 /DNA_ORIENTATION=-